MPSIEDFVQDLYKDAKQVSVSKDLVTNLSSGWYVSKYNFPHKGSKKSWRNGRLHAFDMGDHYDVHLDRVDPMDHGIGHLIEDAPFMLFLWDEFRDASTSIKEARLVGRSGNVKWFPHVIIGIAMLLVGSFIVLNSSLALDFIYRAITGGLLIMGIALMLGGMGFKHGGKIVTPNVIAGVAAVILSVTTFILPGIAFWLLLLVMAVWTLGSGLFLIFGRGDKLQFSTGSLAPTIIGLLSLVLSITILLNPVSGLKDVITLSGLLIAFIGSTQLAVGVVHGNYPFIGMNK